MKAGVLESHHLALPSEEPCWQQFVDSPGSRVGGWGVGGGRERERERALLGTMSTTGWSRGGGVDRGVGGQVGLSKLSNSSLICMFPY